MADTVPGKARQPNLQPHDVETLMSQSRCVYKLAHFGSVQEQGLEWPRA